MKSIIRKSIVVAFASAATLATQAIAQVATNVVNQVDVEASTSGTFSAPTATVVKGTNAGSTYLSSAVSLASSIKVAYTATSGTTTTADGVSTYTYKEALATYAYGNKEILQLALNTNTVTGWALAYTNAWGNNAAPLVDGAYVALKTSNAPVSAVNNWFSVVNGNGVFLDTDYKQTNNNAGSGWIVATAKASTTVPVTVTLGAGGPGVGFVGSGVASGTTTYPVVNVQTFGTNKVTNTYTTGSLSGSFAGASNAANDNP